MNDMRCPECRSLDVIEWDDGWICRDCGCEFDDPDRKHKHDEDNTDEGDEND